MLDVGWTELLVIGVVALLVVGPKDLPRVLRYIGYWMGKTRSMAREFQRAIDQYAKEADLEDVKKAVQAPMRAKSAIREAIDPKGALTKELTETESTLRRGLKDASAGGATTTGAAEVAGPAPTTAPPASVAPVLPSAPADEAPKAQAG